MLRLHILTFVSSNQHNHAFFSSLTTCTYIFFQRSTKFLCKAKTKSDERCWMWRNTFTQHTFYIFLVFSYVFLSKFSSRVLLVTLFIRNFPLVRSFRKAERVMNILLPRIRTLFVRAIHHQSPSRESSWLRFGNFFLQKKSSVSARACVWAQRICGSFVVYISVCVRIQIVYIERGKKWKVFFIPRLLISEWDGENEKTLLLTCLFKEINFFSLKHIQP